MVTTRLKKCKIAQNKWKRAKGSPEKVTQLTKVLPRRRSPRNWEELSHVQKYLQLINVPKGLFLWSFRRQVDGLPEPFRLLNDIVHQLNSDCLRYFSVGLDSGDRSSGCSAGLTLSFIICHYIVIRLLPVGKWRFCWRGGIIAKSGDVGKFWKSRRGGLLQLVHTTLWLFAEDFRLNLDDPIWRIYEDRELSPLSDSLVSSGHFRHVWALFIFSTISIHTWDRKISKKFFLDFLGRDTFRKSKGALSRLDSELRHCKSF
jgi:hypothetical protein